MSDNQKLELVYVPGSMRTVSDKPLALRWLGDKLQYARQWTDGPAGGIEWADVPVEPAEPAPKCDGNHGGPPCGDPGCWNDDPLYESWGVYMHLRADIQGAVELARAHSTEAGTEAWVQFITSRLLHLATVRGKLAGDAARIAPAPDWVPPSESWRWNIERDGDALLICFNQHEKGQPCEVVRYVPARDSGWLIENGKQQGAGLAYRYIDNDGGGVPAWTEDPNKALRFARRADAEQYAHHDEDAWRIVEHAFATGQPK